jgi:hypothetical protein
MSTNRGIFDIFAKSSPSPQTSPFSIADDAETQKAEDAVKSPVASSPFAATSELPETRKIESPFAVAEPPEGFGFEAPAKPVAASPGEPAPTEFPPLSPPVQPLGSSPFSQSAESPFKTWQEPTPAAPYVASPTQPVASHGSDFLTDSSSIRQLELRAIFGVDRELTSEEILQRARGLTGVRHISRVAEREVAAIEGLKNLLPALGLQGPFKLLAGNAPVDFIRDGQVFLAVQTDGGYAPGVRETLMIIARELGRNG